LKESSVCCGNNVVAAEVHLVQINKSVADFWYFDDSGLITSLYIYSRGS